MYNIVYSLVDELNWTSSLHNAVLMVMTVVLSKLVHLLGCKLCCTHKCTKMGNHCRLSPFELWQGFILEIFRRGGARDDLFYGIKGGGGGGGGVKLILFPSPSLIVHRAQLQGGM